MINLLKYTSLPVNNQARVSGIGYLVSMALTEFY